MKSVHQKYSRGILSLTFQVMISRKYILERRNSEKSEEILFSMNDIGKRPWNLEISKYCRFQTFISWIWLPFLHNPFNKWDRSNCQSTQAEPCSLRWKKSYLRGESMTKMFSYSKCYVFDFFENQSSTKTLSLATALLRQYLSFHLKYQILLQNS